MKYYISCPISVSYQKILDTEDLIRKKDSDAQVIYWNRISYYQEDWLEDCDVFVVIFPEGKFKYTFSRLPIGVLREYKKAMVLNKNIRLAYTSQTYTILSLYETRYTPGFNLVEGISGTANDIFLYTQRKNETNDFRKHPQTSKECYPAPTMQEKRLLLFLK